MTTRRMLKSKIHRATVTGADLHYEGSVTIDRDLMDQADIMNNELVDVWNVSAGTRLQTYAIEGQRGGGAICLNGAAARLVAKGDLVIIASWEDMPAEEARQHEPKLVFVDEQNQAKPTRAEKAGQADLAQAI